MTIEEFKELRITKGAFVYVKFQSEKKAKGGHKVIKVSQGTFRLGCSYLSMPSQVDRDKNDIPQLQYGHWVKDYTNILIDNNGNYQLRVYTNINSKNPIETHWYCDGKEVSKEWLLENDICNKTTLGLNDSALAKKNEPLELFNVKLENVFYIGKKVIENERTATN